MYQYKSFSFNILHLRTKSSISRAICSAIIVLNPGKICGLLCHKQVSRTRTSNKIPQHMWCVITCPNAWRLRLVQHSWTEILIWHILRLVMTKYTSTLSYPDLFQISQASNNEWYCVYEKLAAPDVKLYIYLHQQTLRDTQSIHVESSENSVIMIYRDAM